MRTAYTDEASIRPDPAPQADSPGRPRRKGWGLAAAALVVGPFLAAWAGHGLAQGPAGQPAAGLPSKDAGYFNVKDRAFARGTPDQMPAAGDGVHDDTAAIQNAINAVGTGGGVLFFPPGKYLVKSLNITAQQVTMTGAGLNATVLLAGDPSADVITVNYPWVRISNIGFDVPAGVNKTGGAFVNFKVASNQCTLDFFQMNHGFVGVRIASGATLYVEHGSIFNSGSGIPGGGKGSAAIIVTQDPGQSSNDHYIRCVTINNYTANLPSAGIWVQHTGSMNITDCNVINSNNNLYVTGAAGLYAINSFFDSASNGIYISPSTLAVTRCHFLGCWTGSNAYRGVFIDHKAPLDLDGLEFLGHHSFFNGKDTGADGLYLGKGTNINISDGDFSNNGGPGIHVNSGVRHYRIKGNRCGQTPTALVEGGRVVGNTFGIYIEPGTDHFIISDNDLTNNVNGGLGQNSVTPNQRVHDNLQ